MELEFMIMKEGVPAYHYTSNESRVDNNLLASFLGAIQSFAQAMIGQEINNIMIGKKKIYFKKNNEAGTYYILISDDKEKKCRQELSKIIIEFESKYLDKIKKWGGACGEFEEFNKYFNKETVSKLQQAFW